MQYLETYSTLGRVKGWLYINNQSPQDLQGLGFSLEEIEHVVAESQDGRVSDCNFIYELATRIGMPRDYLETGEAPPLPHPKAVMLKVAALYHEFYSRFRLSTRIDNRRLGRFVNDKLAEHRAAMAQETFHAYQLDVPETMSEVAREFSAWDIYS